MLVALALFVAAGQSASAADPKQIYDEATNALYNLDFNTAQHGYETLTREHPDNPDYWNGLASVIWLKISFDQQKLNLESFSGKTLGTRGSKDTVNLEDEKRAFIDPSCPRNQLLLFPLWLQSQYITGSAI